MSNTKLPTPYQQFIHLSKYARWIDGEGRRETWEETVDRYMNFMCDYQCKDKIDADTRKELREAILNLEIMPSMRCMMTAGEALKRDAVAAYNCSFLIIDSPTAFDEMLYILMCGAGVGFSVERQFIAKMPTVAEKLRSSKTVIKVEDSRLGWSNGLRELISMLYQGRIPEWDLSEVRPAGAKLKTFGGRASGPEPLNDLFKFCVETFKEAAGRKLNSIECHDIACKIGEAVVAGGTRRSALLSLSNPSDDRMRYAKSGNWGDLTPWRMMANNSSCYTEKPGMDVFFREWLALYESKSGERGIFNREAATKQAAKYGRRDINHTFGCNPSLRRGTKIFTDKGIYPIEELEGKNFTVRNLNGCKSRAECWLSGKDKPLYEIELSGGHKYYSTAEHQWPVVGQNGDVKKYKTNELKRGDYLPIILVDELPSGEFGNRDQGFMMGWNLGDGWITTRKDTGNTQIGFIVSEKDMEMGLHKNIEDTLCVSGSNAKFGESGELNTINKNLTDLWNNAGCRGKKFGLPSVVWNKSTEDFRKGIIDGLFSSDGCFSDRISLTSIHKQLVKDVSELLGFYGIKNTIKKITISGIRFPNGRVYDREYTRYELQVSHHMSIVHFRKLFSLSHMDKQLSLDEMADREIQKNRNNKIRIESVRLTEFTEDVWDIRVDDETHCFQLAHCITGNCSEIIMRPNSFCNLSEVVIRKEDTEKTLKRKVRLATILGTMQATITHFRYLSSQWKKNTEEEALLGVSFTGIMDNGLMSGIKGKTELKEFLSKMREYAVSINKEWSGKLGINQAAAISCVKPSGNVSQLVDCSSGIHSRHSKYYIRTVRAAIKDPLAQLMINMGFPYEKDITKPDNTVVFSFPIKSPEGAITTEDMSALEYLELWKIYQNYWCEHKPSCTINIRENEWMEVGAWVYRNFDEVSGIAFFPSSNHTYKQAPYQPCSQAEYEKALSLMPKDVDWGRLKEYESDDTSISQKEFACSGSGSCEIVDIGIK